jgi:hypothetical protein
VVDRVDQDGIEPGGGLVEEHDLGLGDQRACDGHAFAHAARDFGRVFVPHAAEADLVELLLHAPVDLAGPQPASLPEGEGHVVEDRHRVEERPALEDDAIALPDAVQLAAPQARDVGAVHDHRAGIRSEQADEVLEQHRLAPAAAADHHHDLAGGDVEVDAAQYRLGAEALVEALDPDHGSTDPKK